MVDYSIAAQIRPVQMPNIGEIYGAAQNIQMNRMRMAEAQEMAQERNALRGLLSSGVDLNTPEGVNALRRAAPTMAQQIEQRNLEGARIRAQTERYGAQAQVDRLKMHRDLLAGVNSPEAWASWRAAAVRDLPQYESSIPREFSPQNVQRMAEGAAGIIRQATAGDRPPVSVAAGSSLVDPRTGRVIFTAPERTQDPARDRRITDIMTTFGVDRATALGVVDGVLRFDADPVTGQPRVSNMFTNQSRPLNMIPAPAAAAPAAAAPAAAAPAAAAPAAAERPRQTLYEMAGTPFTTGAFPAGAAAAQSVLGQVGANVVSPEFTERRQAFGNAQGELIRSLAINPRFPVAEMERIRREINIEPGVLTDPQTLQARMRSIDSSLRTRLANEERAATDTSLPVETRRNAATAANDIRNFLNVLGAPQGGAPARPAAGGAQRPSAQDAAPPVPAGVSVQPAEWQRLWSVMTAEERALWRN